MKARGGSEVGKLVVQVVSGYEKGAWGGRVVSAGWWYFGYGITEWLKMKARKGTRVGKHVLQLVKRCARSVVS